MPTDTLSCTTLHHSNNQITTGKLQFPQSSSKTVSGFAWTNTSPKSPGK